MLKFVALYWRGNPQLEKGGYHSVREVSGKSEETVMRRLCKERDSSCYGSMTFCGKILPRDKYTGTIGRITREEFISQF